MKNLSLLFLIFLWFAVPVSYATEDLNGKKLSCYGQNGIDKEYIAISFVENNRTYFSYVRTKRDVIDEDVTFYDKRLEYFIDPEKIWIDTYPRGPRVFVNRYDLFMGFDLTIPPRRFDLITRPQCKIVDYDPLDKIKEIKNKEKLL